MKSKATPNQLFLSRHKENKSISNTNISHFISTEIRSQIRSIDHKGSSKTMSRSKDKTFINLRGLKDKTKSFDLGNSILLTKSNWLQTHTNMEAKRLDTEERRKTTNGSYNSSVNKEETDKKRQQCSIVTVESPVKNPEYYPSSPSKLYSNSTFAKYLNNIAVKRDSFNRPSSSNSSYLVNSVGNKSNVLNKLLQKNKSKIIDKLVTKQQPQPVSAKSSSKTIIENCGSLAASRGKLHEDDLGSPTEVDQRIRV
jgi:hypothetical protein